MPGLGERDSAGLICGVDGNGSSARIIGIKSSNGSNDIGAGGRLSGLSGRGNGSSGGRTGRNPSVDVGAGGLLSELSGDGNGPVGLVSRKEWYHAIIDRPRGARSLMIPRQLGQVVALPSPIWTWSQVLRHLAWKTFLQETCCEIDTHTMPIETLRPM